MSKNENVSISFWGVRGSIACPGPDTKEFGGNTSCVEVACGDNRIILDAGTGIRALGASFESGTPVDVDILLSHTHLDHIIGLPFFEPAFDEGSFLRFWAGNCLEEHNVETVLGLMLQAPLFPIQLGSMAAGKDFNDFRAGDSFELPCGAQVRTCMLNHHDGATGYRIEYGGRTICYVTDTEHVEGTHDENILSLIDGADVFIYDTTYTDEEYQSYQGRGHSTWQEGAALAERAGVVTYVPFHHGPTHGDEFMTKIERDAKDRLENTVVAREGLTLIV
jgi:phosphoribosyl 1,2-cyclic phosphodiesterase